MIMFVGFFYFFISCDLIDLLDLRESWTCTLHLDVSVCFHSKLVDVTFLYICVTPTVLPLLEKMYGISMHENCIL